MASTNKTPNYDLPQFIASDKPTWLGDVNGAMLAIDTAMHDNAEDATNAAAQAGNAVSQVTQLQQTVTSQGTAIIQNTNSISNLNNSVLNWKGNAAFAADASWDVSNTISFKYNKTLGLLNFSAFLSSSTTIQKGRVICTLPAECRPGTTVQIRAGAFVRASGGITSNCTLTLTNAGVLSVNTIITTNVSPNDLYINVTLACAGWGNNWPALNQV